MKTRSTSWSIFILITLLLGSCTIQKRLFQPGYSIEWKKKICQKNGSETTDLAFVAPAKRDSIRLNAFNDEFPAKDDLQAVDIAVVEFSDPVTEQKASKKIRDTLTSMHLEKQEVVSGHSQKKRSGIPEIENEKEFELFGIMSFGIYFCSLAMAILSIFVLNALPTIIAACFMILLSFIFGIISVHRYRKDKSRYYRNFFGYFGMIASMATITLAAGLVLFAWGLDSF